MIVTDHRLIYLIVSSDLPDGDVRLSGKATLN